MAWFYRAMCFWNTNLKAFDTPPGPILYLTVFCDTRVKAGGLMSSKAPKPGPFAPLPFVTDLAKDEVKTQCAAICYRRIFKGSDEIEVLLITSRDSGRWVIPKGWPMRKKKLHQVARQEARKKRACAAMYRRRRSGTSAT